MIVSPKLDGVRCLINQGAVSRSFKPIPNRFIRETLSRAPDGLDGELIVSFQFQQTVSAVMSFDGEPEFLYVAFDYVPDGGERELTPYSQRLKYLKSAVKRSGIQNIVMMPYWWVNDLGELRTLEDNILDRGHEGIIIRDPDGPYKFGRSTLREGYLLRLKRLKGSEGKVVISDSEAEIIGVGERFRNENKAVKNALGLTERSTAKEGKVPTQTLGYFRVRNLENGHIFKIGGGPGLTLKLRKELWLKKNLLIGKIVKYSFQTVGMKNEPRFPQFLGFRDPIDL